MLIEARRGVGVEGDFQPRRAHAAIGIARADGQAIESHVVAFDRECEAVEISRRLLACPPLIARTISLPPAKLALSGSVTVALGSSPTAAVFC